MPLHEHLVMQITGHQELLLTMLPEPLGLYCDADAVVAAVVDGDFVSVSDDAGYEDERL